MDSNDNNSLREDGDGRWLFEVGGKNKGFTQIKGIENSYVVADKIDIGHGNKIPLWLFGMLY
jgi:hypothetical protein